jgi:hypothetical protein
MAIPADADWRIRTDGNDLNGSIFARDSGGTDYSDQAAAQASWTTSLSMAASTTMTDSGTNNLFTSAMVGNGIQVNGLFYVVVTYTDANNVVVDRSDTFTNQSGKLGGAIHDQTDTFAILNNASATHAKYVSGNRIYIRGSGTDYPTTADYNLAADIPAVVPLYAQIIGYNGRPHIACTGGGWSQDMRYTRYANIYWKAGNNTNSEICRVVYAGRFYNCMFNTSNRDLDCVELRDSATFYDCQFVGTHSNANALGTLAGSEPLQFYGCYFNPGKSFSQTADHDHIICERCLFVQRNSSSYMVYTNLGEDQVFRHCVFIALGSSCDGALRVVSDIEISNCIFKNYTHAGQGAIRIGFSTNELAGIHSNASYNCTALLWNTTAKASDFNHYEDNIALTANPFLGVTEAIVGSEQTEGTDVSGTYTLEAAQFNSANVYKRTSPSTLYMFKNDGGNNFDDYYIIQPTLASLIEDGSVENWYSYSADPGGATAYFYPYASTISVILTDGTPASNPSIAATYTLQVGTHNNAPWYNDGTNDLWFDSYNSFWIISNGSKPAPGVSPSWTDDDFYYTYYLSEGQSWYANNGSESWIIEPYPSVTITQASQGGSPISVPGSDSVALNDTAGGGAACKLLAQPLTLQNGQATTSYDTIGLDIGAIQTPCEEGGGTTQTYETHVRNIRHARSKLGESIR